MRHPPRALIVVAVIAAACSGTSSPSPLLQGPWGGDHVALTITSSGAIVEFDCAHGEMTAVPIPDAQGRFAVAGIYVREHGGPIRQGEAPDTHPALYSGVVSADNMTLTVRLTDTGESFGPFTLRSGTSARVFKCL